MGDFVHRTTKQHLKSADPNGLPEPLANYIVGPDLSAVTGFASIYWTITGDVVTLKSQIDRDAIDAAAIEATKDNIADELDEIQTISRAFAEVVLDEINILRSQHSLSDRTLSQIKTAVRGKL